jgi:hypothetical protein
MLVTVNPEVGGVSTDQKSRFFNVLRCIHAVATAAAGSSPVVNPVNTSGGTLNGSYNCITVISNSEAGGWSNGTSTTTFANTAYNASAGAQYVDLYQTGTGKSTYPYLRATFYKSDHTFASTFTSYPRLQWSVGCSASNPTSVAATSASDYWNNGASGARNPQQMTTYNWGAIQLDEAGETYYIAATANYIIITSTKALVHFGLRTVGGWELGRTDNVPWCSFAYGRGDNRNWVPNQSVHQDYAITFGTGIKYDGTFPTATASKWGGYCDYSVYTTPCFLTHSIGGSPHYGGKSESYNIYNQQTSYQYLNAIIPNYLLSNNNTQNGQYWTMYEPPMTDPITGLSVPAAYPIVFSGFNMNEYTGILGQAYGILRGPNMVKAGLDYFITASEYTINGESWVPIRTGGTTAQPDLFFLRKA